MNRIEFDLIWWKHIIRICVLSGNHVSGITYQVRTVIVFPFGITQDLTQHPADNHDCR